MNELQNNQANDAQWNNAQNWAGPKLFAVYFSKADSRLWVPKRIPWMGWTLNLGHPKGAVWLVGIIVGIVLLQIAVLLIVLKQ